MKCNIVGLLLPKSRVDLHVVSRRECSLFVGIKRWSSNYDSVVDGPLADMPCLKESDRRDILLSTVNCKKVKKRLNTDIPDGLKLVVVASRRWLKSIKGDHDHSELREFVNSLVCCILSCYDPSALPVGDSYTSSGLGERQLDIVHVFAQWQCVLHHVIALNQVLSLPYQYTSVAKLFSGSLLHHYIQNPRREMNKLATDMIAIITRDLFSDSPPETAVCQGACALQGADKP